MSQSNPPAKVNVSTSALPTGAATDGTDITTPSPAMPAGGAGIRGWLSAIWTKLNGTLVVSGTVTVAQSTAANLVNTATQGPANTVGNAWPVKNTDGTNTAAVKAASTAVAAADPALAVSLSPNSPVTQATLTKGTQGATGVSTQDLKDAGRTAVVLSATAVASVTSEAMFTLNIWKASGVTSAASYTVTAGKTFRVQAVQFGCRFTTPSTTVTFANCRFNVRSGGLITSPLVYGDTKLAASNVPVPNSDLAIPDGVELAAGSVIGVSHVDSATTLLLDVLISGYEY